MSISTADPFYIVRQLRRLRQRKHIAFSGGCDSSVLLHLLAHACPPDELHAVHINHGWSSSSNDWEQACARYAASLGIAFTAVRVNAQPASGESPEDVARRARYDALRDLVQDDEIVVTAHHRDDQALTVLLQLLRGAGPHGLAGMPERRPFGKGLLVRPLLDVTRSEIERYALENKLKWIDDDGNASLQFDRNYLRIKLAPVLDARWPGWRKTIARAALHQAEVTELLDERAATDFAACRILDDVLPILCLKQLGQLTYARRKQVLRHWLNNARLRMPSTAILNRMGDMVHDMATDKRSDGATTLAAWRDGTTQCEVNCYRNRLYLVCSKAQIEQLKAPADRPWPTGSDLDLPEMGARLLWSDLLAQAPQLKNETGLSVHFRKGGERCLRRSAKGVFHQDLKKVFQQHGCPPWRRAHVPLIYAGDDLRLVWGVTACG